MMEEPEKCIGFTLAVLLFEILLGCHPFEGRKLATMAFIKEGDRIVNYGEKRVFIFDPQNNENAPIPGEQTKVTTRWVSLPEEIRDAFIKVFVEKHYFLLMVTRRGCCMAVISCRITCCQTVKSGTS